MGLGAVIADILTDLHLCKFPDKPRAQDDAYQKGGKTGIDRPKGDVPEDIEYRYGIVERVQQKIDHGAFYL